MEKGKVIPFPADRRALLPRPNAYILRVYLVSGPYGEESVGHEIFRTLKVRGDQTLEDLHHAIFCAYGREQDRYYDFCLSMDPNDPEAVRYTCREALSKYGLKGPERPGKKVGPAPLATVDSLGLNDDQFFGYWFDLVEEWIHLIHVIAIEPADLDVDYPLLIEKQGVLPDPVPRDLDGREFGRGGETLREEDVLILLMGEMQIRWRKQIEDAPIRPNTRLKTALAKLPSHWLDAIGRQGGLEEARNRKDRIDALVEWLPREESLRQIWNSLPLPSREVLNWILREQHGAAKIQNLSRRYGADTDITWWWSEGQRPETPLGMLRSRGLVYVGKIRQGRRRFRLAVVPVELRKTLIKIAAEPPDEVVEEGPWPGGESEAAAAQTQAPEQEASGVAFIQEKLLEAPSSASGGPPASDPWKGLETFNLRSFLSVCPLRKDTEGMYARALGRIRRHPDEFPRRHVRSFLTRMTRGSSVWSRLEAYKLGLVLLDERFVEPALSDSSRLIQQWARNALTPPQENLF